MLLISTPPAANPPAAVMANLNVTSGLVLISWSPPAAGGAEVTGYRIYYSLEGSTRNEPVASNESQFVLDLKGTSLDNIMAISIRTESAKLPSELININVTVLSTISIASFGDNTAGESYSLECSFTVTGSIDKPTITWLDDGLVINSTDHMHAATRMVSMTTGSTGSYSSTLTFSPLRASDSGMFVCRAILGDAMNSQSFSVAVQGKCNQ